MLPAPNFASNYDRILPQNVGAEEAILGGILLDSEALARVINILPVEAFALVAHQQIYQATIEVYKQGRTPDLMIVATYLMNTKSLDKIGGENKLAMLVDRTISAVNIDQYAELVLEKYAARQAIASAYKIIDLAYSSVPIPGLILESRSLLDDGFHSIPNSTHDEPKYVLKNKNRIDLSEVLPAKLANPLKLLAKNYPCPEEVLLHSIIPIIASLVNPETNILIRKLGKRPEYPIIRSILISESSNRKSDLERMLLTPLDKIQDEWDEKYAEDLNSYNIEMEEWENLPIEEKKKRKSEQPAPPSQRFFTYTEGTKEGLCDALMKQPGCSILWAPDEILAVKTSQGEYKGGKGSDTESNLSAFNARKKTIFRKGAIYRVKDSSSVMGGIQPRILPSFIKDLEDGRGELARYLPFVFDLQAFIVENDVDLDISPALQSLYEAVIQLSPQDLIFSDRAKRLFTSWQNSKELQRVRDSSPGVRAFIGKLESYCAKIAMILHLIWEASEGQKTPAKEVPAGLVEKAIQIAEFYMEQYLRIRQIMGVDSIDPIKDTILDRLKVMGAITVSNMRTASRSFRRMRDAEILLHFQEIASANPGIVSLERSKQGTLKLRLLKEGVESLSYSTAVADADRKNDTLEVSCVRESPENVVALKEYSLTPCQRMSENVTNPLHIVTFSDTPVREYSPYPASVPDDSLTHDTHNDEISDRIEETSHNFKIGDRVIIDVPGTKNHLNQGTITTIDSSILVQPDGAGDSQPPYQPHELRHIPAAIYYCGSPANVGDKVKSSVGSPRRGINIAMEYQRRGSYKNPFWAWMVDVQWMDGKESKEAIEFLELDLGGDDPSTPNGGDGGSQVVQEFPGPEKAAELAEWCKEIGDNHAKLSQLVEGSGDRSADESVAAEEKCDRQNEEKNAIANGDTAITLHQPWATLIAQGKKQYETRSWGTDYRGKILIHAAKREIGCPPEIESLAEGESLPSGAVVASAKLVDCILMTEEFIDQQSELEICCGHWEVGRYAWKLENIKALETPFPLRGYQKLWRVRLPHTDSSAASTDAVDGEKCDRVEPARPKFAVGDRVKVKMQSGVKDKLAYLVCREGIVTETSKFLIKVRFESERGDFKPHEVSLYPKHLEIIDAAKKQAPGAEAANSEKCDRTTANTDTVWEVKGFKKGDTVRLKTGQAFDGSFLTAQLVETHFIVDHYIFKVQLDPLLPLEIVQLEKVELKLPLPFNRIFGERLRHKKSKQAGYLKSLKKNHQAVICLDDGTDIKASIKEFEPIPLEQDTPAARAGRIYQDLSKGMKLRIGRHEDNKGYINKVGVVTSKRFHKGGYQAAVDFGDGLPVAVNLEAVKICN